MLVYASYGSVTLILLISAVVLKVVQPINDFTCAVMRDLRSNVALCEHEVVTTAEHKEICFGAVQPSPKGRNLKPKADIGER